MHRNGWRALAAMSTRTSMDPKIPNPTTQPQAIDDSFRSKKTPNRTNRESASQPSCDAPSSVSGHHHRLLLKRLRTMPWLWWLLRPAPSPFPTSRRPTGPRAAPFGAALRARCRPLPPRGVVPRRTAPAAGPCVRARFVCVRRYDTNKPPVHRARPLIGFPPPYTSSHELFSGSGQVMNEAIRTERVRLVVKDPATGTKADHLID